MHKNRIIMVLGLFIIILPFLGFPRDLKYTLITIVGFVIVILSFLIERHISLPMSWRKKDVSSAQATFAEHNLSDISDSNI